MPIKYPAKYAPKYYNPNWGNYSRGKLTWEHHYGVGAKTPRDKPKNVYNTPKTKNTK